jgi:hypothetical protein
MRFWKELRNPALKCERIGHKHATRTRSGMVWSKGHYVADRVEQECDWCPRCGIAHGEWRDLSRTGISSWSAPSDVMREFERTGAYWH